MKIGGKLLSLGSAILLIPLATVGFLVTIKAREGILVTSKETVNNMARSMAQYTDMRLQGDTRFVVGLADDGDIKRLVRDTNAGAVTKDEVNRINEKLSALKMNAALETQFDSLSVIDRNGKIAACQIPELVGMDLSMMEFFKNAIARKAGVGQMIVDNKQPPNAGITASIYGDNDEIIGVCGVFLNPIKKA